MALTIPATEFSLDPSARTVDEKNTTNNTAVFIFMYRALLPPGWDHLFNAQQRTARRRVSRRQEAGGRRQEVREARGRRRLGKSHVLNAP